MKECSTCKRKLKVGIEECPNCFRQTESSEAWLKEWFKWKNSEKGVQAIQLMEQSVTLGNYSWMNGAMMTAFEAGYGEAEK